MPANKLLYKILLCHSVFYLQRTHGVRNDIAPKHTRVI